MYVVCYNCGREWKNDLAGSDYQELALLSEPCPACESYTLGCRELPPAKPAHRPHRFWLRPRTVNPLSPKHRS